MLELGVVHRGGAGHCGPGSALGAGGNATQFKLLAQPPHFIDTETKTRQRRGVCRRLEALGGGVGGE